MTLVILLIYYIVGVISCQPVDTPSKKEVNSDPPTLNTDNSPSLLEICIQEVCKDKKNFEDLTLLQQGMVLGKMDEKYATEKKNNIKSVILPILRGEVEDYERKYLPSTNLNESSMVQEVRKKDPKFSVPESMLKAYILSLHYVRWQYILHFSTHPDITELRTFLAKHHPTTNNEAIAKALAMFYEKASHKIHGAMADLTEAQIEEGLMANGLQDRDMIAVIKALLFIPKGRKDELSIQSE